MGDPVPGRSPHREGVPPPTPPSLLVASRVEVPCGQVGFTPPPARVHVKLISSKERWSLLISVPAEATAAVVAWLAALRPRELRVTRSGRVVRAEIPLASAPPAWGPLVARFRILGMLLTPDGVADIHLEGAQRDVATLLQAGSPRTRPAASLRAVGPPRQRGALLTARQHEALVEAAAHGFYRVPRGIRLADLAKAPGTSPAALSELLRRAEARVVHYYAREQALGADGGDEEAGPEASLDPGDAGRGKPRRRARRG